MLAMGFLNQPRASGPTGCRMKPFTLTFISFQSWS